MTLRDGKSDWAGTGTCTPAGGTFDFSGAPLTLGKLTLSADSQSIASATTQIVLPSKKLKTVTTSGTSNTWTLDPSGSTPVIATSGAATNQELVLMNTESSATECVVLQDKAVQTGSALVLRGASLTLCGGDPGVLFIFNGTDWIEQAGGWVAIYRNGTAVGIANKINLDVLFSASMSGNTVNIAPGASILTSGSVLLKANLPSTSVHTDQANPYTTGDQEMGAGASLSVRDTAGTGWVLQAGKASVDGDRLRLGLDPSDALDAATKQYVDARFSVTIALQLVTTNLPALDTSAEYKYGIGNLFGTAGGDAAVERYVIAMPAACVVTRMRISSRNNGSAASFPMPTGATLAVVLRKNATDGITCSLTQTEAAETCTGSVSFAEGDHAQYKVSCSGTCTDTTNFVINATAVCAG